MTLRHRVSSPKRLHEPDLVLSGVRDEARYSRVADASPRNVQHPAQCHLVTGVHNELQVGEQVPDLTAIVETRPPDHLVRNAPFH